VQLYQSGEKVYWSQLCASEVREACLLLQAVHSILQLSNLLSVSKLKG